MKKYLSKKRVCAILISISMLISTIALIPIPIEHVSAEYLYSAEETTDFAEPIILPVTDDDDFDGVVIDTTDNDTTYIDTTDSETTDIDTADDDKSYIDNDETSVIIDNDDSNTESDVSDSTHCEYCEEGMCVCEHDDALSCESCGEEICICSGDHNNENYTEPSGVCHKCGEPCGEECTEACKETCRTETSGECECCMGECKCGGISRLLLRSDEDEPLVIKGVNTLDTINSILSVNIDLNLANRFEGSYAHDQIVTMIQTGWGVEIHITQSLNIPSPITIPANRNITLVSQDNTQGNIYSLNVTGNYRHFLVNKFGSLILRNITVNGNQDITKTSAGTTRGGIDVVGGSLTMQKDSMITNCSFGRNDGTGGGAVTITKSGLLTMYDGTISGNLMTQSAGGGFRGGGAVYLSSDSVIKSTFVLYDGYIEKNFVKLLTGVSYRQTGGGGVYVASGGQFAMEGGYIRYNEATPTLGMQNGGGGVLVAADGHMMMTGGIITKNHAINNGSLFQGGGGIFCAGIVLMGGGRIHDNTADWEGGGVFVAPSGEFYMFEGEITDNYADSVIGHGGGGVMIMGGIFKTENYKENEANTRIIRGNRAKNNSGGFSVLARYGNDFTGPGLLEIVDGTIITKNEASSAQSDDPYLSNGGAIAIDYGATLNLYGGNIYNNTAGNGEGIAWLGGTINLKGNPRVGSSDYTDAIHRHGYIPQDQIMNIVGPLGDNAFINVQEDINDKGRSDLSADFTVIAIKNTGQRDATDREASLFHYMGTGNPRSSWNVIPHTPNEDPRLILGRPLTKFTLLHVPDTIHFGVRPLLTTNLVGPYGDAPLASDVKADYDEGMESWSYGFEIANTRHNNWTLTLQAVPFTNKDGIIGANPVAVSKDANNPTPEDLNDDPLIVISRNNLLGESIKWHWTQLDYKIEAQTALDTVVKGDFQSVFTWTLMDIPPDIPPDIP